MAEACISVAEEQFCCPICLSLLKDPVTIPCGHSYCMTCMTAYWNMDDQKGVYSCPQCRQAFTPRPVLGKNTILAEMVEKLEKTSVWPATPDAGTGAGDVECDICTGEKLKAVRSCMTCLNSYCQTHLEQHENFFKDKKHQLLEATGRLQEMVCKIHNRPLEAFCRTDMKCICTMCMLTTHKSHDTSTLEAERMEKMRLSKKIQKQYMEEIQQKKKSLQELRKAVDFHKISAQAAVDDSERIFTELICYFERRRSEVTHMIREKEKATVSRAEGLMKSLENNIDYLKSEVTRLEQLSHTDDQIHFIKSMQSLLPCVHVHDITVSSNLSFDKIGKAVALLRGKLEDFCTEEIEHISARVKQVQITTKTPTTRREFLQYYRTLSLDSKTAHQYLCLSQGNTAVTNNHKVQQYPKHPDRFADVPQVFCRESVSGCAYWEVEWSGNCWASVSVSYKSIKRRGNESAFGGNDQSWTLENTGLRLVFCHGSKVCEVTEPLYSSRIGVYVDHNAGTLSFYNVSDEMTLLKRVETIFTEPLYPGFKVSTGSSVKICDLK